MSGATICTPLRSERAALYHAVSAPVVRTGRGPARRVEATGPVLVAGVAGALTDELRPGDLVVADELRTHDTVTPSHVGRLLYGAVRRLGLRAHLGPLLSRERVADGRQRAVAGASGAIAVDTETAYLARQAPAGQTVALRAIVDTPSAPLMRVGTITRGITALRALRAAAPVIDAWAAAVDDREIVLAGPPSAGAVAERCDLVLMLGSPTTAGPVVHAAENRGTPGYLVDDAAAVDLRWLVGARRVGIIAAASARQLRDELVGALSGLGQITVDEISVLDEDVRLPCPER
jgi:4-hydroxy-3-methylbut-2-en-1-yl diphosphate reductase